jgi:hypothetical protein
MFGQDKDLRNKQPSPPILNWRTILFIIVVIAALILVIFPLVYSALSGNPNNLYNQYNALLQECIYDSDCGNATYWECYGGKCFCVDGWFGENCTDQCLTLPQNPNCTIDSDCSYENVTVGACKFGMCDCDPGYDGGTCNLERRDIGICDEDSDCLNGGVCVFVPSGAYGECYCPEYTLSWNCLIV